MKDSQQIIENPEQYGAFIRYIARETGRTVEEVLSWQQPSSQGRERTPQARKSGGENG